MKTIKAAVWAAIISIFAAVEVFWLLSPPPAAAQIVVIKGSDNVASSRTTINNNFAYLDANKQATVTVTSPLVKTGNNVSMPVANSTTNGYLSSADWTTFSAGGGGGIAQFTTVTYSATPTFTVTAASIVSSFKITLTGNVSSSTLSGANTGMALSLTVCQDGTGGRTFVYPTNVLNFPAVDRAPNACTSKTGYYDGTNVQASNALTGLGGVGQYLTFVEGTVPTNPPSGSIRLYARTSDDSLHIVNSAGTDFAIATGSGSVTSVGWTGGIVSVANPTTTPAFTIAGTSGGIPYFSSSSAWASSGVLGANLPLFGGGAGASPIAGTRSGNTTQVVTTTGAQTNGDCVKIDADGNHVANGAACGGGGGSGTVTSVAQSFTGGLISVAGSPITVSGTLALTVAGTSGGIPYFSSSSTWATSAALTANLPVIGGGAGAAPAVGTRSGNTTAFVTTTGTQTSGDCVKIDANGNHVANGSACGAGGGGDFVGPASATNSAILLFDGTSGKLGKNSGVTVDGSNNVLTTGNVTSGAGGFLSGGSVRADAASFFYWSGSSVIGSPSNGVVNLLDTAQTSFGRLCIGPCSASFPAIKRSSTAAAFVLGNDSGDAPITAGAGTFSGIVTVLSSAAPSITVVGQIAQDNNLWAASRGALLTYDGTSSTALVATLVSDTPSNLQVPMWNTGGTITWEPIATACPTCVTTAAGSTLGAFTYDFSVSTVVLPSVFLRSDTAYTMTNGQKATMGLSATTAGIRLTSGTLPSTQAGGDLFLNASGIYGGNNGTNAFAFGYFLGSGAAYPAAVTAGKCLEAGSTLGSIVVAASNAACGSSGGITGTLTATRVPFASGASTVVDDADMTFVTDTLTVTKIIGSTSITNSALTSGRVVFSGASGIQSDDADLTFSGSTLTITDLIAGTSIKIPNSTSVPGTCAVAQLYFDTDATAGSNLFGCTATNTWTALGGGSGATTALDNLASTAVNASIIPATSNAINLGSATKLWATYSGQHIDIYNSGLTKQILIDSETGINVGGSRLIGVHSAEPVTTAATATMGADDGLRVASNLGFLFSSTTTITGTQDTGLSRVSAGVIGIGTGAIGSVAGSLSMTNFTAAGATIVLSGLGSASGTPDSVCLNTNTVVRNAALTCTVSSENVKNGFASIPATVQDFMHLRPMQFEYNDRPGRIRWGFGAQQVASVDRALADGWREDGQPWSLDQNAILALTVKALQETRAELETLKNRVR